MRKFLFLILFTFFVLLAQALTITLGPTFTHWACTDTSNHLPDVRSRVLSDLTSVRTTGATGIGFLLWFSNFTGDLNNNSKIDIFDYNILISNFGKSI